MNIDDRRVRRSRRLLGDALLSLIEKHDFDTIKVRDVTDLADVGYMTFYRHYDTLEDLLIDRIRNTLEEWLADVIACDEQGELIFTYVAQHARLYRTLLFAPNTTRARQKLAEMFAQYYRVVAKDDALIPADLRAHQMANGLLSLVGWWLNQQLSPPITHMATIYNTLIIYEHVDEEKVKYLSLIDCKTNTSLSNS